MLIRELTVGNGVDVCVEVDGQVFSLQVRLKKSGMRRTKISLHGDPHVFRIVPVEAGEPRRPRRDVSHREVVSVRA